LSLGLAAAFTSTCGTPPSDDERQPPAANVDRPLFLRITSLSMNGHSANNSSSPVQVYVTLPGLPATSTFLGRYTPNTLSDPSTQFNCDTAHARPAPTGYCTTNLPLRTSAGPLTFSGTFPANATEVQASVRINGATTRFTIDGEGNMSQSCATAWMYVGDLIDGDQVTVCWHAGFAYPFIAPPTIQAIFYPAPGESSSVQLTPSNTISTKTTWSMPEGGSFEVARKSRLVDESFNVSGSQSFSEGLATITGSSTGFTLTSKSMLPDPADDTFLVLVGARALYRDLRDGNPPTITEDLSTAHLERLTLGQMRGLAQTPPDFTGILGGDQEIIRQHITPAVAREFIAQDPFSSGAPIADTVANNPGRFQPADPSVLRLGTSGTPSRASQVHGSRTDDTVGHVVGGSYTETIAVVGATGMKPFSVSVTHTDTNRSTASVTLATKSSCMRGTVDLYMDKAYGTVVSVPRVEDSCGRGDRDF
jgi:hypothetical protein